MDLFTSVLVDHFDEGQPVGSVIEYGPVVAHGLSYNVHGVEDHRVSRSQVDRVYFSVFGRPFDENTCSKNIIYISQVCSGSVVVTTLDCGPRGSWFKSRVGANIL